MPRKNKKFKNLIECSNDYFLEAETTTGTPEPASKIATTDLSKGGTSPVQSSTVSSGDATKAPTSAPQAPVVSSGDTTSALKDDGSGIPISGDSFAAGKAPVSSTTSGNTTGMTSNPPSTTNTVGNTSGAGDAITAQTTSAAPAAASSSNMPQASTGGAAATSNTANGGADIDSNPTGAANITSGPNINSASGMTNVAQTALGSNTNAVNPSAQGSATFNTTEKPTQNLSASAILLSKLLPTESELKRMNKTQLRMVRDMITNSGLTESMIKEATKEDIPKQFLASQELAKEVLKDPINATKISVIVYEGSESFNFNSINGALNIMSLLGKAAENNAKVNNDTLSSALKGFGEVANTGIRSMQKLINENADWLSIVMSKPLNQWNIAFAETPMKNWKCSQLFTLCAVLSSVVFTCHKILSSIDKASLSTNTVENNIKKLKLIKSALKESKALFVGINHLIETDLGVNAKLSEYADGKIPTNVILINSMILKAGKPAKDLLARAISEKEPATTVDKSISINRPFYTLCIYAASLVLLWIKIAGMYIKNADDINIVSNMMSDKIRAKIDPSEKNVLKSLFSGLQTKLN